MPAKSKAHYGGSYQAQAAAIRQAARIFEPVCPRCGEKITRDQAVDAGHVNGGQIGGQLRAEHATCNRRAGAIVANQRRRQGRTSRDW